MTHPPRGFRSTRPRPENRVILPVQLCHDDAMKERTLTDGTVWLSRPTEADIDAMVAHCQHPSIGAWITIPVPYGREDAETFLRDMVEPGWSGRNPIWALRPHENGPLIGTVRVGGQDETAGEVGYWLAHEHRGRGLMSRAVALVCEFGFDPAGMDLARIGWHAYVGNHASAAVVRRNGFRYEGMARLGAVHRDVRRDTWLAGRLATDPPGPADGWPAGI